MGWGWRSSACEGRENALPWSGLGVVGWIGTDVWLRTVSGAEQGRMWWLWG